MNWQAMEDRVYTRAVAEFERLHPDLVTLKRDRDDLLKAATPLLANFDSGDVALYDPLLWGFLRAAITQAEQE